MRKNIYCLLLLLTTALYGQGFTGPGSDGQAVMASRIITVSEARNLSHDSWVVLAGNIINMLPGGRQYTFRDATGDIAVDIGPKEWRGLSVDVTDRVEIYGEVKIHRGQTHIKVHAITGTGRVNNRPGQAVTVTHPITIHAASVLPHDSWVVLHGNIVSSFGGEPRINNAVRPPHGRGSENKNYLFRDASGEITIDIGRKEWRGLFVGVSDSVEIYGEVKNHRGQIHIKVHAIMITGV
ncbi:MAG: NirD/YgiW/YdeI family stress tolerance protein [Treponema sp.]|nr:NirD/YgiW/YdeI family stress tolerance protein [Treponema sp.]